MSKEDEMGTRTGAQTMTMVNAVSGSTLPPLGGNSNLTEGILSTLGISPIGVGLHEPA